jgi:hypothetical protein
MVLALVPALMTPLIVGLARGPALREWFVRWSGVLGQAMLVLAVAALVMAIAVGVITWRRERRRHA